jgi:histone H3/H4
MNTAEKPPIRGIKGLLDPVRQQTYDIQRCATGCKNYASEFLESSAAFLVKPLFEENLKAGRKTIQQEQVYRLAAAMGVDMFDFSSELKQLYENSGCVDKERFEVEY